MTTVARIAALALGSAATLVLPGVATAAVTPTAVSAPTALPAGAIVVAPDGTGDGAGTAASPLSLEAALAEAGSGDTVALRGGDYHAVDVDVRTKVDLMPYPGEKPVLKGSETVSGFTRSGSTWVKSGWTHDFSGPEKGRQDQSESIDPMYPMAAYRDLLFLDGKPLRQVAKASQVKEGTFAVDSGRLVLGSDPSGGTVEASVVEQGFTLHAKAAGSTVKGLTFTQFSGGVAAYFGAPRVTVEGNTFTHNAVSGASVHAAPDAVVRGNTFSVNGRSGVGVSWSDGVVFEGNTLTGNNTEQNRNWGAGGVKVTNSDGVLVRGNQAHNNIGAGLWMDISVTNATIVNNVATGNRRDAKTSEDKDGSGIFFEISDRSVIASNVLIGNDTGISVHNSSRAKVWNNTLVGNGTHLSVGGTGRTNDDAGQKAAGITWDAYGNEVKNNLMVDGSGEAMFNSFTCTEGTTSKQAIASMDFNGWFRDSTERPRQVFRETQKGTEPCKTVPYPTLAKATAATGFEKNGVTADDVTPEDVFVNAAGNDYHLKAGSPAVGKGTALPADVAKAIGVEQGGSVDLGALRFGEIKGDKVTAGSAPAPQSGSGGSEGTAGEQADESAGSGSPDGANGAQGADGADGSDTEGTSPQGGGEEEAGHDDGLLAATGAAGLSATLGAGVVLVGAGYVVVRRTQRRRTAR